MDTTSNGKKKDSQPKENLDQQVARRTGASQQEIATVGRLKEDEQAIGFDTGVLARMMSIPGRIPFDLFRINIKRPANYLEIRRAQEASLEVVRSRVATRTLLFPPTFSPEAHADLAGAVTQEARDGVLRSHHSRGTLYDSRSFKISEEVMNELGQKGRYWGQRVPIEFEGLQSPRTLFMPFLSEMTAKGHPAVGAAGSVNGCLGGTFSISNFGTIEQKEAVLRRLGRGEKSSCLGLTEEGAGADILNLHLKITRHPTNPKLVLINGAKFLTTNMYYSRIAIVVGTFEGKFHQIWFDVPKRDTETFRLVRYGLHAVKGLHNCMSVYTNFEVPIENLLPINKRGGKELNGVAQVRAGLNDGRVAVAAICAGDILALERHLTPGGWCWFRWTLGQPLARRMFPQTVLGTLPGIYFELAYLSTWCAADLDLGHSAEDQCIVTKIAASDGINEAVNLAGDVVGGRSFLEGNVVAERRQEAAATKTFEGPTSVLYMYLFKKITEQLSDKYFDALGASVEKLQKHPIAAVLSSAGMAALLVLLTIAAPVLGSQSMQVLAMAAAAVGAMLARSQTSRGAGGLLQLLGSCAVTLLAAVGCGVIAVNAGPLLATHITPALLAMAIAGTTAAGAFVLPRLLKSFQATSRKIRWKENLLKNLEGRLVSNHYFTTEKAHLFINALSIADWTWWKPNLGVHKLSEPLVEFLSLTVNALTGEEKSKEDKGDKEKKKTVEEKVLEQVMTYLTSKRGFTEQQVRDLVDEIVNTTNNEKGAIKNKLEVSWKFNPQEADLLIFVIYETTSSLKGDKGKRIKHDHGPIAGFAELVANNSATILLSLARDAVLAVVSGVVLGSIMNFVASWLGISLLTTLTLTALCGGVLGLAASGHRQFVEVGFGFSLWLADALIPRFTIKVEGVNDPNLLRHLWFIQRMVYVLRLETVAYMVKHREGLYHLQKRAMKLGERWGYILRVIVPTLGAAASGNDFTIAAVDARCQTYRNLLTGRPETDQYHADLAELGKRAANGEFSALDGVPRSEIMFKY